MDADLEYLANLYIRLRALDRGVRTFRVMSPRTPANDQCTTTDAVDSKVSKPPGT